MSSAATFGTTGSTTRRATWWQLPDTRRRVVDLAAVTLLLATGVLAFGPVFGGAVGYAAAGAGAAVGLAIGTLTALRRWSPLAGAVGVLVAYLLLGGPLALPGTTIGGVVPTVETLQRLVLLLWQSWRDLLTVSLPAGEFDGPAALPLLTGLLAGSLTGALAIRARRPLWAVLPPFLLLVIGILWGANLAPLASLQGALFAGTTLAWLSWRSRIGDHHRAAVFVASPQAHSSWLRQAGFGGLALLLAGLGATGVAAALGGDNDRHVLRDDVTPPLDLRDYPSPLTMFRKLEAAQEDDTLFTVQGLPSGARIRLAAMDVYDGNVFNVTESSAEFERVGQTILPGAQAAMLAARDAEPVPVTIDVKDYQGIWLPGGGDLRGIEFRGAAADREASGVYANPASGTVLTTAGVATGTSYRLMLVPPPAYPADAAAKLPKDAQVADVELPTASAQVDAVPELATTLVGQATTPMGQLQEVARALSTDGFYANGKEHDSLAGHTTGRIQRLLANPSGAMIGDDEQYAVAMALIARQLGLPARVVMGFYPEEPAKGDAAVAIKGGDSHVWVEVPFKGLGWVPFDPTPNEDNPPDEQMPEPQERNEPQVLPPPEIPEERDPLPPVKADSEKDRDDGLFSIPGFVKYVVIAAGTVGVVSFPFWLVLFLKRRRAGARRGAGRLADRISGGWAELTDTALDLGIRVPHHATRKEAAGLLANRLGVVAPIALAGRVDAHVFGDGDPTDADVDHVWSEVGTARATLLGSVPRHRRLAARFSPLSLVRPSDRTEHEPVLPRLSARLADLGRGLVSRLPRRGGAT